MQKFEDKTGQEWPFEITIDALRDVRRQLGVNLLDLMSESGVVRQFASDPALAIDAFYLVAKPAVEKAGLTSQQFGERFDGEALDRASWALLDAIADFFQRSEKGPMLRALLAGTKQAQRAASKAAQEGLAKLEAELSTSEPGS
jgi:hypothetical protein